MNSKKRNYKCKSFHKPSLLKRHEIGHSNNKPFKCNDCNEQFTQKSSLNRHRKFPPLKCNSNHRSKQHSLKENEFCGEDADENLELTAENVIKELKNLQNIKCNISDYGDVEPKHSKDATVLLENETIQEIRSHEKSVNIIDNLDGEKKVATVKQIIENRKKWLECNTCSKKFRRSHDLLRHFRSHTKEKKFECGVCKKKFSLKCTLNIHMKIHQNTKNSKIVKPLNKDERQVQNRSNQIESMGSELKILHQCETCKKPFKKSIDLKRHIWTHTKEKNFLCEICDKRFTLKSTLKDHKETHSVMRTKVECQVCGKKYANKSVLKVHIRMHFNEMPYSCDHENCTKTFRTIGHQKQHLKQHQKNST